MRELEAPAHPGLSSPLAGSTHLMASYQPRVIQMYRAGAPAQEGTVDCGAYALAFVMALRENRFPDFSQASPRPWCDRVILAASCLKRVLLLYSLFRSPSLSTRCSSLYFVFIYRMRSGESVVNSCPNWSSDHKERGRFGRLTLTRPKLSKNALPLFSNARACGTNLTNKIHGKQTTMRYMASRPQ